MTKSGGTIHNDIRTLANLDAFVGRSLGNGPWVTVTQEMVDQFGELTGDRLWIHMDPDRAVRESPYGRTIAHGMLTISLIPLLKEEFEGVSINLPSKVRVNYGFDRIRYPAAVLVGARIRVESTLAACTMSDDSSYVDIRRIETIEIEGGDRPAAVVEALSRWYIDSSDETSSP